MYIQVFKLFSGFNSSLYNLESISHWMIKVQKQVFVSFNVRSNGGQSRDGQSGLGPAGIGTGTETKNDWFRSCLGQSLRYMRVWVREEWSIHIHYLASRSILNDFMQVNRQRKRGKFMQMNSHN